MKTSGYGYANYVSFKSKSKIKENFRLNFLLCWLDGWMDEWMDEMFCYCFSLFYYTQNTGQLLVDHCSPLQ